MAPSPINFPETPGLQLSWHVPGWGEESALAQDSTAMTVMAALGGSDAGMSMPPREARRNMQLALVDPVSALGDIVGFLDMDVLLGTGHPHAAARALHFLVWSLQLPRARGINWMHHLADPGFLAGVQRCAWHLLQRSDKMPPPDPASLVALQESGLKQTWAMLAYDKEIGMILQPRAVPMMAGPVMAGPVMAGPVMAGGLSARTVWQLWCPSPGERGGPAHGNGKKDGLHWALRAMLTLSPEGLDLRRSLLLPTTDAEARRAEAPIGWTGQEAAWEDPAWGKAATGEPGRQALIAACGKNGKDADLALIRELIHLGSEVGAIGDEIERRGMISGQSTLRGPGNVAQAWEAAAGTQERNRMWRLPARLVDAALVEHPARLGSQAPAEDLADVPAPLWAARILAGMDDGWALACGLGSAGKLSSALELRLASRDGPRHSGPQPAQLGLGAWDELSLALLPRAIRDKAISGQLTPKQLERLKEAAAQGSLVAAAALGSASAEAPLTQIGLTQIGLTQIGLTQIGLTQIGLTQIGLAQPDLGEEGRRARREAVERWLARSELPGEQAVRALRYDLGDAWAPCRGGMVLELAGLLIAEQEHLDQARSGQPRAEQTRAGQTRAEQTRAEQADPGKIDAQQRARSIAARVKGTGNGGPGGAGGACEQLADLLWGQLTSARMAWPLGGGAGSAAELRMRQEQDSRERKNWDGAARTRSAAQQAADDQAAERIWAHARARSLGAWQQAHALLSQTPGGAGDQMPGQQTPEQQTPAQIGLVAFLKHGWQAMIAPSWARSFDQGALGSSALSSLGIWKAVARPSMAAPSLSTADIGEPGAVQRALGEIAEIGSWQLACLVHLTRLGHAPGGDDAWQAVIISALEHPLPLAPEGSNPILQRAARAMLDAHLAAQGLSALISRS